MNSYHAHHARLPTIAKTTTAKGREIRAVAGATVTAGDDALAGSEDGAVANAAPWATRPNFTNSQTPTPTPMSAPRGPMLKKAPIATPPSRSGPANAITRNARPNHPASMPTKPERKPRTIRMIRHFNERLNAVYVSTSNLAAILTPSPKMSAGRTPYVAQLTSAASAAAGTHSPVGAPTGHVLPGGKSLERLGCRAVTAGHLRHAAATTTACTSAEASGECAGVNRGRVQVLAA